MKPILFIDRDGTLIKEPQDNQIDNYEKLDFMTGVFTWLGRICKEFDYYLVMVTNQDGLGTPGFPEESFWGPHELLLKALKSEGIVFNEILIDGSFPDENLRTRKPGTGLVEHLLNGCYDIPGSWVIGDRETDEQFAKNIGCRAIRFGSTASLPLNNSAYSWEEVYKLLKPKRESEISRKTSETDINIKVNLDGGGKGNISTGIGFFDHMLDQLAKHSSIDLFISCIGDLRVDEHHTIEDVGIALGEALKKAIGSKVGIARFGFTLPMDESCARVTLDFSGRPYLVFNGSFFSSYVGQMPTEMVKHFFHSLAYSAGLTVHIDFEGENDHHKVEAIFKAFAKSLSMAIKNEGLQIPTTKGLL